LEKEAGKLPVFLFYIDFWYILDMDDPNMDLCCHEEPGDGSGRGDGARSLRVKSLLMLIALALPTLLTILEILTGRVSGWWVEKAAPLLPHIELVHF
jgi:hypothetical protein